MEYKKNDSTTKIVLIIVTVILFFMLVKHFTSRSKLKKSFIIANGKISDFGHDVGGKSISPYFTFKVNQVKIERPFSMDKFCNPPHKYSLTEKREILNQNYLVIYNPDKPEISEILLHDKDFEKYGVPYPDSLRQVLETYFDCK